MKSAIIALADLFNNKITIEINGLKLDIAPEDAPKLADALYDAKHKIDLERIP